METNNIDLDSINVITKAVALDAYWHSYTYPN